MTEKYGPRTFIDYENNKTTLYVTQSSKNIYVEACRCNSINNLTNYEHVFKCAVDFF